MAATSAVSTGADRTAMPAQPSPLAGAFGAAELSGLRLATRTRIVSTGVVALMLLALIPQPAVWYFEGLVALLALSGVADYALARRGALRSFRYLFVAFDFALLMVAIFVSNPLADDPLPAQMVLRNNVLVYAYLLLALVAFSLAPGLMLWAGLCAAVMWAAGIIWLVGQPGTITEYHAPQPTTTADVIVRHLDPGFVDVGVSIQGVIVLLLVVAGLAVVVRRSRDLVVRQAALAHERANLSRYFAPTIVERLARDSEPLGTVRSAPIAVLFADLVGFTRYAEAHAPAEVVATLRHFHGILEAAVFDHQGTLDKFLGDGIMATFGTPEPGPRDATNAIAAARVMLAGIDRWNEERERNHLAPQRLAIGVHYGEVVLGNIGSERRLEFAALGDAVNVASRLEALTRRLDCRVALSGALVRRAETEGTVAREGLSARGPQALPGRAEQVEIWAIA